MSLQKLRHIFTKIVFIALRTNLFHIVFLAFLLTSSYNTSYSQELREKSTSIPSKNQKDSINIGIKKDSVTKKRHYLRVRLNTNRKIMLK